MCGIVGFCATSGASVDVAALERAVTRIRHRGPDDEGYMLFDAASGSTVAARGRDTDPSLDLPAVAASGSARWSLGLGHRRLSIIDLSSAGHQPMASPDGRQWITYNGEIYNYRELRTELQGLGVKFRSASDTEVLLAAYRQWGNGMLQRLVGMYAFAIVDLSARVLFAARDPFGIKPFYFARTRDGLAFASEIKALLAFDGISRDADPAELFRFVRFGILDGADRTLFRQVEQLPAGHCIVVDLSKPTEFVHTRHWAVPAVGARAGMTLDTAAEEVRRLLMTSVGLHLRSDVPVGTCLSGGLDSTIIAYAMRQTLGPAGDLHTFTYHADDAKVSEAPFASLAASAVGAVAHTVTPTPQDIVDDLDDIVLCQDQPISGTSVYAQYCVFRLAHEAGVKVLLDGQGSDEFFGGYNTAVSAQLASFMARGRFGAALQLGWAGTYVNDDARRRIVLAALGRFLPAAVAPLAMAAAGERVFPGWVREPWFRDRGVTAAPRVQGRGRNALHDELVHSVQTLSLPQLLRFEDRNSMRFSIESRVPFCVPAIAEFALSLPGEMLVTSDGETKSVLRRAFAGRIPAPIIERPKVGFSTPEQPWLEALKPWARSVTGSATPELFPFLAAGQLEQLTATERQPGRQSAVATWRILLLIRWAQLLDVTFT
jgi:asparagine synthase (glutamine-hydrolysing)